MTLKIFPSLQVCDQNFCRLRAPTVAERQGLLFEYRACCVGLLTKLGHVLFVNQCIGFSAQNLKLEIKALAQSMLKRWLSPLWEQSVSEDMLSKLRETTFDDVVDAQSAHYQVPAIVMLSITKKVQSFSKLLALVMDEKRGKMWCEAIGSQAEMDTLATTLSPGKPMMFSCLCYKRSQWHSGGKYLDLTKKQKVKVVALAPTHSSHSKLMATRKDGPATLGDIAGLRGLERGHKADLTALVCSVETKILKDGQVGSLENMI